MISKANALIIKGNREETRRLLMEVVCEAISWFRTDLVTITMSNLSKHQMIKSKVHVIKKLQRKF